MNAGTLIFDKSSQNANRLLNNAVLTLGGGSLVFSNSNASINPTAENPGTGGTVINSGASSVLGTNVSASGGNVTFGAFTRRAGGTLDVAKVGGGSMTTTTANNNGILGGWATWFGTDWLVGTALAAYSAYTTSSDATTWLAGNNVSLAGNPLANLDDTTINSLRLSDGWHAERWQWVRFNHHPKWFCGSDDKFGFGGQCICHFADEIGSWEIDFAGK
jgi:hypothetical protein